MKTNLKKISSLIFMGFFLSFASFSMIFVHINEAEAKASTKSEKKSSFKQGRDTCVEDTDCVPASCCHATEVVNRRYAPKKCGDCTMVCSGPLDCGAGHPACVNEKCVIQPN